MLLFFKPLFIALLDSSLSFLRNVPAWKSYCITADLNRNSDKCSRRCLKQATTTDYRRQEKGLSKICRAGSQTCTVQCSRCIQNNGSSNGWEETVMLIKKYFYLLLVKQWRVFFSLFFSSEPICETWVPSTSAGGGRTGYGFEMAGKRPEAYIL